MKNRDKTLPGMPKAAWHCRLTYEERWVLFIFLAALFFLPFDGSAYGQEFGVHESTIKLAANSGLGEAGGQGGNGIRNKYAEAKAVVERLHSGLLEIMKAGQQGASCRQRYEKIEPIVREVFDFPLICRIVLGRAWKKLGIDEQKRFIEAFSSMSIATYAKRFKSWDGERFEIRGVEPSKRGRVKVKTVLIKKDGDEVDLDYLMHPAGVSYKIVSVIAMGVSDLSLKRVEYAFYLKTHSIDELISKLKEQSDECR